LYYWKPWKQPRTRRRHLPALGADPGKVHVATRSRKQGLGPDRESAVRFWREQVKSNERKDWQLERWAEAMRWHGAVAGTLRERGAGAARDWRAPAPGGDDYGSQAGAGFEDAAICWYLRWLTDWIYREGAKVAEGRKGR
jgi:hypothetical protein